MFCSHRILPALVVMASLLMAAPAWSAGGHNEPLPQVRWSFDGMFGTYDRLSMQRGYKVYREVCSACHSMKKMSYRNLADLGYDEGQVKNIVSQYTVTDGPNDEGEMFDRPGMPSDHFVPPYSNDNASKAANNGALPPDLSLIIKARHDGANYVHALLNGYEEPPSGKVLQANQHYNKYMPGNILAMAKPLQDGQVAYEDGTPETVEQYSRDVVNFLAWASEPYMEQRKRIGLQVIMFLIAFAAVMYAVKRKIWSDIH